MPRPEPANGAKRIVNAMTIDVEDYFHANVFDSIGLRHRWDQLESRVCGNTERLLQIFDDAGVSATFFILGWVAERFPALVRRIAGLGHEVASHGYEHILVYDQTPRAFREDIRRAKAFLEGVTGAAVLGFRAPSYSVTTRSLWALDVLIEEGYQYDASIFPIHHDRYGIPGAPRHPYRVGHAAGDLMEVPASTVRVGPVNIPVAGGGYFRLFPYALTRWGMRRVNRVEGKPAVFYFHPWEIDPKQPRLGLRPMSRFRHYRNLAVAEHRFRRLLGDFSFAPLRAVLSDLPAVRSAAPAAVSVVGA